MLYVATPVSGSATIATSAVLRPLQPVDFCHAGAVVLIELQPETLIINAVSNQPRVPGPPLVKVVPPTAMTPGSEAG